MVRVIWLRLSRWTDVGESLDLILDLTVALTARSGRTRPHNRDALARTVRVRTIVVDSDAGLGRDVTKA